MISQKAKYILELYEKDRVEEVYGKKYFDFFGKEIPEELLEKYFKNIAEFEEIQQELDKIYKKKK